MICVLVNTPLGASTVIVSLDTPTAAGCDAQRAFVAAARDADPAHGATDSLDEATVTVSSFGRVAGVSDGERHRWCSSGRSSAAGKRVFRPSEMVGAGGGVPPEPIVVPGAKATPRKASLAGALAISSGTPLSVPLTPLTSEILYRAPVLPVRAAAGRIDRDHAADVVGRDPCHLAGTSTDPCSTHLPPLRPYLTIAPVSPPSRRRRTACPGVLPEPSVSRL